MLFALLLRGKEKFPNVRKVSFPLERLLQGHHWNLLSSGFSGCLRTPQHGMEYVVWMYTFFGERVHSWPPVLQRVYEAKKKLWTTDTRPGLLTFVEVHASNEWEFGFGTVAGPVPPLTLVPARLWSEFSHIPAMPALPARVSGGGLPGARLWAPLPSSVK